MLLIWPKSGTMHMRVLLLRQLKNLCHSLQYVKLDSLFQNYPYSDLPNKSDWSPVNLAIS